MNHKSQLIRKTEKSCVLNFPWYFVPILPRTGNRFLNPCKKTQSKSVCFQRQTQEWWIEGGKGYGAVVTFSSFILVVKATHFGCRRPFLCLRKQKPTLHWTVRLFVYMGNEDGLLCWGCVAGKKELGLAGLKAGQQVSAHFCPLSWRQSLGMGRLILKVAGRW